MSSAGVSGEFPPWIFAAGCREAPAPGPRAFEVLASLALPAVLPPADVIPTLRPPSPLSAPHRPHIAGAGCSSAAPRLPRSRHAAPRGIGRAGEGHPGLITLRYRSEERHSAANSVARFPGNTPCGVPLGGSLQLALRLQAPSTSQDLQAPLYRTGTEYIRLLRTELSA